ncbi:hypothetical protein G6F57_020666 [Rhizopus arrhizus]|nr:hypothetical protein G6F57_020666 [Rhizopus arrhizus]
MARRTALLDGPARQLLDAKLAALLQAYESQVAAAAADIRAPDAAPPASALAGLIDYLADPDPPGGVSGWTRDTLGLRATYPDVQMLDYFRGVWSQVSADRQVRQSQEQVHKNAGPLNSNQLVHRALTLMRELSPGYLQQCRSYPAALMWRDHAHVAPAPAPAPKETARAGAAKTGAAKSGAAKKTPRAKTR